MSEFLRKKFWIDIPRYSELPLLLQDSSYDLPEITVKVLNVWPDLWHLVVVTCWLCHDYDIFSTESEKTMYLPLKALTYSDLIKVIFFFSFFTDSLAVHLKADLPRTLPSPDSKAWVRDPIHLQGAILVSIKIVDPGCRKTSVWERRLRSVSTWPLLASGMMKMRKVSSVKQKLHAHLSASSYSRIDPLEFCQV